MTSTKWIIFTLAMAVCASIEPVSADENANAKSYDGVGAIYIKADRTEWYQFLSSEAKYNYAHPLKPIPGQVFQPDLYDTPPTVSVHDCSNVDFRCLALDDQAFAVPRRRLASMINTW